MSIPARARHCLLNLPITYRIAIGNALIIAVGAVGGTLLTRHLATRAADLWLILLFLSIGITVSVLANFWIVRNALQPLRNLAKIVNQLQLGISSIDPQFLKDTDPDICQLATVLNMLVTQLNERNQQLRALSQRVINAQEEERKRIALSLHDDTGQALITILLNLEQLEKHLPPNLRQEREKIESIRQLASQALQELRKIVIGLRPSILDDLGLVPAIRWYARSNLEAAGILARFHTQNEHLSLSPEVNSTLFRIAQEAINNIVRHSKAKSATIKLSHDENGVKMSIEDDGQGFELNHHADQALSLQHLGLLGIQERARLVGGNVIVQSTPGKGTQIDVFIPQFANENG